MTWPRAIAILLALAGLALALRHDLAALALSRGNTRLQAGDIMAAEAEFKRSAALGGETAPLAYNLGVSLYRKGDFARARTWFDAALSTTGPELRAAIHYNRGNCQFRLGERQAARGAFQAALADYGRTLALTPKAVDAGDNLNLTRARLAALARAHARPDPPRRAGRSGRDEAPGEARRGIPGNAAHAAKPAARADASARPGKPYPALSRQETLRLLNEARGREKPMGTPRGGKQPGEQNKPEKDW